MFNEIIHFSPDELQAGGQSGLGLWIARSIVQMHHGKVYLHSDGMGKGSTFYVDIPAYTLQSAPLSLSELRVESGGERKTADAGRDGGRSREGRDENVKSFPPTPIPSPTQKKEDNRDDNVKSRPSPSRECENIFDSFRVLVVDVSLSDDLIV